MTTTSIPEQVDEGPTGDESYLAKESRERVGLSESSACSCQPPEHGELQSKNTTSEQSSVQSGCQSAGVGVPGTPPPKQSNYSRLQESTAVGSAGLSTEGQTQANHVHVNVSANQASLNFSSDTGDPQRQDWPGIFLRTCEDRFKDEQCDNPSLNSQCSRIHPHGKKHPISLKSPQRCNFAVRDRPWTQQWSQFQKQRYEAAKASLLNLFNLPSQIALFSEDESSASRRDANNGKAQSLGWEMQACLQMTVLAPSAIFLQRKASCKKVV